MDVIPIKPERKAQLEAFAQRHGKDTAAALDDALAEYLEWEQRDYQHSVAAIRRGDEDVKAGRTRPATEFLEELRVKHGFPR
jgi:predicted transcriptional regulator